MSNIRLLLSCILIDHVIKKQQPFRILDTHLIGSLHIIKSIVIGVSAYLKIY